jgi:hypothetical protein
MQKEIPASVDLQGLLKTAPMGFTQCAGVFLNVFAASVEFKLV